MEAAILIADDDESFLSFISDFARKIGIVDALFKQSLGEVVACLGTNPIKRLILDNVFEGDNRTGLEVLERCSKEYPQIDRFLVTGQPISPLQIARLSSIDGRFLHKGTLTADELKLLLTCAPDIGHIPSLPLKGVDIGVLSVELDLEKKRNKTLKDLTDLLADDLKVDIIAELDKIKSKDKKILYIGGVEYNATELISAVRDNDDPGPLLIQLHRKLFRKK